MGKQKPGIPMLDEGPFSPPPGRKYWGPVTPRLKKTKVKLSQFVFFFVANGCKK